MNELDVARAAAERAAQAAAEVIREHLASGDWQVSYKRDDSPVTDVDVAAERAIRQILSDALPQAALDGEELGQQSGSDGGAASSLVWRIDPIDGTKSFVRGMPFYSTQIALERDGELVVGVSNAPAWQGGERLVAVAGGGVTINGEAVRCSQVETIDEAFLSSGNLASLALRVSAWSRYGAVVARARRTRGYGDFAHYHQLCCGQCDLVVESDVNILDIAAVAVGVREAGGTITDLAGRELTPRSTSVLAAATGPLHREALALIAYAD